MNKVDLTKKLDDLRLKSESTIAQITDHEKTIEVLREEALLIKGRYQAIEELIKELPDVPPKSKVPKKASK